MHVALADGLECHVRVAGRSGPAVVLVHGFAGSSASWPEGVVADLAQRARVLAPDLVGHGRSTSCHEPWRYGVHHLAGDVLAILDVLDVETAVFVGYSMGGRLALATAVLHPDRVTGLVLEGASPGIEDPEERQARRAGDERWATRLERDGIEAFAEAWTTQALFASRSRLPLATQREIRERLEANDPRALAACLRGFGRGAQPSFWSALSTLEIPIDLIVGADDAVSREVARRMHGRLPRSCLTEVPSCGHTVHLEDPDAWLEVVQKHLACVE